jgi:hypothetical protein
MMRKKKLVEIKAEVAALLRRLPTKSPRRWLEREIETAKKNRKRDVETLKMLCSALEREGSKVREPANRRRAASRRARYTGLPKVT